MKTITLDIEDEFLNEFLDRLEEMINEEGVDEKDILISGLTISEYKLTIKIR